MRPKNLMMLLVATCLTAPMATVAVAPSDHRPLGISWHEGSVDSAFALAQREQRPVFMYWGAVWCPPCNQLKATLFKRPDFIRRMRSLVPVYIDGDAPGAQHLGARFKVRGYPTTVLFRPDGSEITRLPGEVSPERYLQALETALRLTGSVRSALQTALAGGRRLPIDEWRRLAYYAWETDEQQLAGRQPVAAVLRQLAARCADAQADKTYPTKGLDDLCTRLSLKSLSLAAQAAAKDKAMTAPPLASVALRRVLADPGLARANLDILVDSPDTLARYAAAGDPDQVQELVQAWDQALTTIGNDPTLAAIESLAVIDARIALAQVDDSQQPLSPELLASLRAAVDHADRATTDANERQSVISQAADILINAGLLDEADTLLRAELVRSHSPYYFMLGLADIAKRRGDKALALDWYTKAHDTALGPATRLQWGAIHVRALIELSPEDGDTIQRVTTAVLAEIRPVTASFQGRNRAVLDKLGAKLSAWGDSPGHAGDWTELRHKWLAICTRLPKQLPERAACRNATESQP
jgi:thioredoxin-related protein